MGTRSNFFASSRTCTYCTAGPIQFWNSKTTFKKILCVFNVVIKQILTQYNYHTGLLANFSKIFFRFKFELNLFFILHHHRLITMYDI